MTGIINRRQTLALLGGTAAAAALGGRAMAQGTQPFVVNTYGGRWEDFWRKQVNPGLEGIIKRPIRMDIGLGNAWVTSFRAAGKDKPPFTALMFNERFATILRAEGFFSPLPADKIPNLADVYPIARYDGDISVTGIVSPIGIAYRTDLIKTPPQSWKDLWKPEYKGQLGMYAISNSLGIMMLMLASQLFGKDQYDLDTGFKKLKELKPFPQVDFSGALAPLLTQGQVAIAPIDIAEAVALQKKGVPIKVAMPSDGILMFDQCYNVLAAGPDKEAAYAYINYMLSPEIQEKLMREFYVAPTNRKVVVPDDLKEVVPVSGDAMKDIVRFDWGYVAKNRDAILDRWSREI